MGYSAKLPNPGPDTYRFTTHRKYLAGFIDAVIGSNENDPVRDPRLGFGAGL